MAAHTAKVHWKADSAEAFASNRYSRAHTWEFDGGAVVPGSSSPTVVPVPMSDPKAVDPEEAFVASLSSCHMLWFLFIAGKKGFSVVDYTDEAKGILGKNAQGRMAMLAVELSPAVAFDGKQPTADELAEMHHQAHEECYLANSVTTVVTCRPIVL